MFSRDGAEAAGLLREWKRSSSNPNPGGSRPTATLPTEMLISLVQRVTDGQGVRVREAVFPMNVSPIHF